jgi:hypothetical protein
VDKLKVGRLGADALANAEANARLTYLVDPQLSGLPVLFLYSCNLCQTDFTILLSITAADRCWCWLFPVKLGFLCGQSIMAGASTKNFLRFFCRNVVQLRATVLNQRL